MSEPIYDCTKGYTRSTYVTLYCEGQLPPRYPVPAIIVEYEILPDRVISWSGYGHTTDYKYLAFDNEAYF